MTYTRQTDFFTCYPEAFQPLFELKSYHLKNVYDFILKKKALQMWKYFSYFFCCEWCMIKFFSGMDTVLANSSANEQESKKMIFFWYYLKAIF